MLRNGRKTLSLCSNSRELESCMFSLYTTAWEPQRFEMIAVPHIDQKSCRVTSAEGSKCRRRPTVGCCFILVIALSLLQVFRTSRGFHPETLTRLEGEDFRVASFRRKPSANEMQSKFSSVVANNSSLELGPIFYNIYFPIAIASNKSDNLRIIEEQLLERSFTAPNSAIWYTFIGNQKLVDTIDSMCTRNCQMREHLANGDEAHTLQALWEYCLLQEETDSLVSYIHNKGSFHRTESNERARRLGTKSSLECRALMKSHPNRCNVCTSEFHVIPQYLGNSK